MDSSLDLDLDPSFEPQQRARSNTWPLPRPDNYEDIKEESDVDVLCGMGASVHLSGLSGSTGLNVGGVGLQQASGMGLLMSDHHGLSAIDHLGAGVPLGGVGGVGGGGGGKSTDAGQAGAPKKNSSRRNAWGNMSYADLITQAIQSSADKRLTLSQIYDWMVQNVPYFKDKGDSNSSAGWKVSPPWLSVPLLTAPLAAICSKRANTFGRQNKRSSWLNHHLVGFTCLLFSLAAKIWPDHLSFPTHLKLR